MTGSEPTPSSQLEPPNAAAAASARKALPIVTAPRSPVRAYLVHAFRICLFLAIIWLIHDQHRMYQSQQADRDAAAVVLDTVLPFFPTADSINAWDRRHGGRVVTDAQGEVLGFFLQTSPITDHVLGYSGPTNTLIAFNQQNQVVGVTVLSSGDTPEHVADVLRDRQFLETFVGRTWDEVAQMPDPDGVAGATLTSMAIAEGIRRRLGGTRPSLRFPAAVTPRELSDRKSVV